MNLRNIYIIVTGMLILSGPDLSGQNRYDEEPPKINTWSVTGFGGITRFFGDIRQYDFKRGEKEALTGVWGISVNKQISPLFGAQLTFSNGSLAGSKRGVQDVSLTDLLPTTNPDGQPRLYDVYFKSPSYIQVSLDGTANLNRLLMGYNKMQRWKIDAHAGFGIMYFYSRLYDMADDRLMLESNTPASSRTAGSWERNGSVYTREWVFPVGLSVHYEVSPRIDIGVDFTYNHVNTEKIDLTVGSLTSYERQSGLWGFFKGDSKQDKYAFTAVAVTYKLGKNAVKVQKGHADPSRGRYHLRWTNPDQLIPVPYNPTMADADSIAKANMPEPVDPRLYTDSDGDGVADLFDKEPGTPPGSIVSGGGVAVDMDRYITRSVQAGMPKDECEALFSNIEFDTDKATIRSESRQMLDKVVALLNTRPDCRVVLVGHTDARASDSYNTALSRRRVDAAKRQLIRAGLNDPSRILTEYYGELVPVADNSSPKGMQANRRVEIRILPSNTLRSGYPAGFRPR